LNTHRDVEELRQFDAQCNAYLTIKVSGPDSVTIVPPDGGPIQSYVGDANQNMGYALIDPDPAQRRVVVAYSCCTTCGCQAKNGVTLLFTCDRSSAGCGCSLGDQLPRVSRCAVLAVATSRHQRYRELDRDLDADRPHSPLRWIRVSIGQTLRLIRSPLKELLAQLDPSQFVQVHRSVVVNLRAISHVTRGLNETGDIHLKDRDEVLPVSRTFFHHFRQM
jgi:hypothetical protein